MKTKKKQRQPKLRTRVEFNTGSRRHKSIKDYNRAAFKKELEG